MKVVLFCQFRNTLIYWQPIYYEEDFKDRYDNIDAVVLDTYDGGYYSKEE